MTGNCISSLHRRAPPASNSCCGCSEWNPGNDPLFPWSFRKTGPSWISRPGTYSMRSGVEFEEPEADRLDDIIERFGLAFPTTAHFSSLARLTLPDIQAEDDPDAALLAWLTHEEALFRRLEKRIVSKRLEEGFADVDGADVDGFIRFSLSVHNRPQVPHGLFP